MAAIITSTSTQFTLEHQQWWPSEHHLEESHKHFSHSDLDLDRNGSHGNKPGHLGDRHDKSHHSGHEYSDRHSYDQRDRHGYTKDRIFQMVSMHS